LDDRARLLPAFLRLIGQPVRRSLLEELFGRDAVEEVLRRGPHTLRDGFVLPRGSSPGLGARLKARYLRLVRARLEPLLSSPGLAVAGLSGSFSYGVLMPTADLDLFLVVKSHRLVRELIRSFLLLRILNRGLRIPVQLSFAVDERSFRQHMSKKGDILVKRDASRALVLKGPRAFLELSGQAEGGAEAEPPHEPALGAAEALLFGLASPYIRLRALLHNLKLRRAKRYLDMFSLTFTPGSYVVESRRYSLLRRLYARLMG
jgi:hypothetical protein